MVLVIELENALAHMHTTVEPSKMWSPYREPLAKFLNKYTVEVAPQSACGCSVAVLCTLNMRLQGRLSIAEWQHRKTPDLPAYSAYMLIR